MDQSFCLKKAKKTNLKIHTLAGRLNRIHAQAPSKCFFRKISVERIQQLKYLLIEVLQKVHTVEFQKSFQANRKKNIFETKVERTNILSCK